MSTIQICEHPFESKEAYMLVRDLEADLAAFYPDWDELSHPNEKPNPRPATPLAEVKESQAQVGKVRDQLCCSESVDSPESNLAGLLFFVAFDAGLPVGCAALRLLSATSARPEYVPPPLPEGLSPTIAYGELKRMFVVRSHRGTGLSKRILAHVEKHALTALRLDCIVLEVGLRQKAAVQLYSSAGYLERSMYGEYQGMSVTEGGDSICCEKKLPSAPTAALQDFT